MGISTVTEVVAVKKKSAIMYLCVVLAAVVSGLCVPSSWYQSLAPKTVASLNK
jgi:hypothetical protein